MGNLPIVELTEFAGSRRSPRTKFEGVVASSFGWAALLFVFLQLVDAIVPQIRMALHDGYMGRDLFKPRPFLVLPVLGALLCFGLRIVPVPVLKAWIVFLAYLTLLIFIQQYYLGKDPVITLNDFADTYSYVLILPMAFSVCGLVSEAPARRVLIVFLPFLCILGICQYVLAAPIVRPMSLDGKFAVLSWTFNGSVRGFSLFTSALWFGYYLTFAIPLVFISMLRARSMLVKFSYLCLFVLSLAALFTTITRNAYLLVLQSLLAIWVLRGTRFRFTRMLPLIFLGISGFFTLCAGTYAISTARNGSVFSGDSLAQRLGLWALYLERWLYTDVPTTLFGAGLSQNSRLSVDHVVIDNTFIATGCQIGLIGVFLFYWLLWRFWVLLASQLDEGGSSIGSTQLAGVAFWSTFLSSGVLNYSSPPYVLYFIFFMILMRTQGDVTGQRQASDQGSDLVWRTHEAGQHV